MQNCKRFSLKKIGAVEKGSSEEIKGKKLKSENQIAETEYVVRLAKTKVQFYEDREGAFQVLLVGQIAYRILK